MKLFDDGPAQYEKELHHGVVAVAQPVPFLTRSKKGLSCSDGGNCYALALLAVLRRFGLDDGMGVAEAIDLFEGKYASGEPLIEQSRYGMEKALARFPQIESAKYFEPAYISDEICHGASGLRMNHDRDKIFETKIREGYLLIAGVYANSSNVLPPVSEQSDHWIVIDGVRERHDPFYYTQAYIDKYKELGKKAGDWAGARVRTEFRWVDSSTRRPGARWIDAEDYGRLHGGAEGFFVRKAIVPECLAW